jgi:hypothetical protein
MRACAREDALFTPRRFSVHFSHSRNSKMENTKMEMAKCIYPCEGLCFLSVGEISEKRGQKRKYQALMKKDQ